MRLDRLAVNELSREAFGWVLGFLTTVDSRDPFALGVFFAERCTMQVNNDPVVEGRTAVLERLPYLAPSFRALEHELLNAFGTDRSIALEGLNHCARPDAMPVALRAATFIDRDERGLVTSIRLYTDTTELYVQPGARE